MSIEFRYTTRYLACGHVHLSHSKFTKIPNRKQGFFAKLFRKPEKVCSSTTRTIQTNHPGLCPVCLNDPRKVEDLWRRKRDRIREIHSIDLEEALAQQLHAMPGFHDVSPVQNKKDSRHLEEELSAAFFSLPSYNGREVETNISYFDTQGLEGGWGGRTPFGEPDTQSDRPRMGKPLPPIPIIAVPAQGQTEPALRVREVPFDTLGNVNAPLPAHVGSRERYDLQRGMWVPRGPFHSQQQHQTPGTVSPPPPHEVYDRPSDPDSPILPPYELRRGSRNRARTPPRGLDPVRSNTLPSFLPSPDALSSDIEEVMMLWEDADHLNAVPIVREGPGRAVQLTERGTRDYR